MYVFIAKFSVDLLFRLDREVGGMCKTIHKMNQVQKNWLKNKKHLHFDDALVDELKNAFEVKFKSVFSYLKNVDTFKLYVMAMVI